MSVVSTVFEINAVTPFQIECLCDMEPDGFCMHCIKKTSSHLKCLCGASLCLKDSCIDNTRLNITQSNSE